MNLTKSRSTDKNIEIMQWNGQHGEMGYWFSGSYLIEWNMMDCIKISFEFSNEPMLLKNIRNSVNIYAPFNFRMNQWLWLVEKHVEFCQQLCFVQFDTRQNSMAPAQTGITTKIRARQLRPPTPETPRISRVW